MSTKASPITPEEAQGLKNMDIPSEMIEAVNHLIIKNWKGTHASFKQKDLLKEYLSRVKDPKEAKSKVYDYNHFDFEDLYRQIGWKVNYESPCYGDSDFDAYFEFEKKSKGGIHCG